MTTDAPPPAQPPEPPDMPDATPPGKGLAVASLLCGIGGVLTCGASAVVGVILGIVALVKLSKAGATDGRGLAVAGVVVSGLAMFIVPVAAILVAILMPSLTTARGAARQAAFTNTLRQLSAATMTYTAKHDNRFPPPQWWPRELETQGMLSDVEQMTRAPGDRDAGRAVAMNAGLAGMTRDAVRRPSETVLFFECGPGSPPAGGPDLLPDEPRYDGKYLVAFVDGHVNAVRPEEIGDLVWDPGKP
jgi:hypothetical protein